jgi:hypothetical protein
MMLVALDFLALVQDSCFMTKNVQPLTAREAIVAGGMMRHNRAVMCCRMCA